MTFLKFHLAALLILWSLEIKGDHLEEILSIFEIKMISFYKGSIQVKSSASCWFLSRKFIVLIITRLLLVSISSRSL